MFSAILNKRCIFLHGTFNFQYIFAVLFLKLFFYKCYIIPHGTLDLNRRSSSRSFLVRNFSKLYIKYFLYSNYLIFTNLAEYHAVKINQPHSSRLHFIPNFVPFTDETLWLKLLSPPLSLRDESATSSIEKLSSQRLELEIGISNFLESSLSKSCDQQPVTLFFFGRLAPEKGIDLVIPTLSRLYREGYITGLVVLGGTDDASYESYVRTQFSLSNMPLYITGFLQRPIAHSLLQLFRPALVFPSTSDNFNLSLHECLNFGLTLFASTRINTVSDCTNTLLYPFNLENHSSELYKLVVDFYKSGDALKSGNFSTPSNSNNILDDYNLLFDSFKRCI